MRQRPRSPPKLLSSLFDLSASPQDKNKPALVSQSLLSLPIRDSVELWGCWTWPMREEGKQIVPLRWDLSPITQQRVSILLNLPNRNATFHDSTGTLFPIQSECTDGQRFIWQRAAKERRRRPHSRTHSMVTYFEYHYTKKRWETGQGHKGIWLKNRLCGTRWQYNKIQIHEVAPSKCFLYKISCICSGHNTIEKIFC